MGGRLSSAAHARRFAIVLGVVVLAVAVLTASRRDLSSFADQASSTPPPPSPSDPIIDNGSFVQMGVNPEGHLNVAGGTLSMPSGSTTSVGLRYIPTNGESTAPGCLCEGWGVANADGASGSFSGFANVDIDGGAVGLTVEPGTGITNPTGQIQPESVGSAFKSIVSAGAGRVRVTHDYNPSSSPNLYQVDVTIENIGGGTIGDLRYRRVMDWDIAPFTFEEYVEIHVGTAANLVVATTDGFRSANPLADPGPFVGAPATTLVSGSPDYFAGPTDQGALFDFSFGSLASGQSRTFTIFYGAAADRSSALNAIASVGGEVYSLGLPREASGEAATDGPHAFIFAFKGVGGTPLPTPTPCAPEGCPTPTITRTPTSTPTPTETPTPTPTSPPPIKGNDNFARAVVIPSPLPYSNKEDNVGATRETDEPQPCVGIGSTVWYSYTSPTNQVLQADTNGSNFDTALAVYTGSALNALTLVACDDDSGPGLTSQVVFSATAGTTYYFQAGGFFSNAGNLVFNLAAPPTPTPTLTPTPTRTPAPPPIPDFSINVRGADCSTEAGHLTKCNIGFGLPFTLEVRLDSLPLGVPTYEGFDLLVTYTGVISHDNPSTAKWPGCQAPAFHVTPGVSVQWSCSKQGGSSYLGPIGTLDFECNASGRINLVHGVNQTQLFVEPDFLVAEGEGIIESLEINCQPALGGVADYPNVGGDNGLPVTMAIGGIAAVAIGLLLFGGSFLYIRRRKAES